MSDWGCPDWRDVTAYPSSPEKLTDGQWRWAFLRRLPKYRSLWKEHSKHSTEPDSPFIAWAGISQAQFAYEFGRHNLIDPAISEEDSGFDFFQAGGNVQILCSWWDDPDNSETEKYALNLCKENLMLQDSGLYQAVFDITKPLKPQLKLAERSLEHTQEMIGSQVSQFKNRRDEWVRHLRIIDAKDQAATHEEFFANWAEEETGGGVEDMDQYYRDHKNAKATVSQWHKQAIKVMEKASRLL